MQRRAAVCRGGALCICVGSEREAFEKGTARMGQNLPTTVSEMISWAEAHEPLFTANAVSIGITAPQALAFKGFMTTARANFNAAEAARVASKNATKLQTTALTNLRNNAGALVGIIKAFAEATNNPNVYSLSGVSAPDPRGTIPPPEPATNLKATLNPSGSLTIGWKATQPSGAAHTVYLVYRQLASETGLSLVATVGAKKWTDETLPRGVDGVNYMVQSKRSEELGPESDQLAVTFGTVDGPGLTIASMTSRPAGESRLAA